MAPHNPENDSDTRLQFDTIAAQIFLPGEHCQYVSLPHGQGRLDLDQPISIDDPTTSYLRANQPDLPMETFIAPNGLLCFKLTCNYSWQHKTPDDQWVQAQHFGFYSTRAISQEYRSDPLGTGYVPFFYPPESIAHPSYTGPRINEVTGDTLNLHFNFHTDSPNIFFSSLHTTNA